MNGNTYSSPVYNILTGIGREGAKTHTRSFTPCFKKNNDGMTEENALDKILLLKNKEESKQSTPRYSHTEYRYFSSFREYDETIPVSSTV